MTEAPDPIRALKNQVDLRIELLDASTRAIDEMRHQYTLPGDEMTLLATTVRNTAEANGSFALTKNAKDAAVILEGIFREVLNAGKFVAGDVEQFVSAYKIFLETEMSKK
jgi:hypothetical protein